MKLLKGLLLFISFFLFLGGITTSNAQTSMTFKIAGNNFVSTVNEAVLINIGGENFIQIKATRKDQLVFLYLKEKSLKGELPVTLKYKEHDPEKLQSPDAEMIWAPEGGEQPAWNTIEGEAIVTQYDPASKRISATFEFVVEKQNSSTKKDIKMDRADIEDGKIDNIKFTVDASAVGK